jgi:ribosomal protein L32
MTKMIVGQTEQTLGGISDVWLAPADSEDDLVWVRDCKPQDTGRVLAALVQVAGMLLQEERSAAKAEVKAKASAETFIKQMLESMHNASPSQTDASSDNTAICGKCGNLKYKDQSCIVCGSDEEKSLAEKDMPNPCPNCGWVRGRNQTCPDCREHVKATGGQ